MHIHHDPFFHRNADGLIDFDRYRTEAKALRRQARQDDFKLGAISKLVVIVVVMLGAIAVAPSRQDANATCRDCLQTTVSVEHTAIPQSPSLWNFAPQYQPIY